MSDESHSSPSPSGPPHNLAAWQQQQLGSLGGQLGDAPPPPAMPQLQGGASGALLGCSFFPLDAQEQLVPRQYAGREHSVTSLPSMHLPQRQQSQQQQEQGQLAGGPLPAQAMAGSMHGGLATAQPLAMQARAGEGVGSGAFGMHLPAGQVPAAAAAQNPYSPAGLLLRPQVAAAETAYASSNSAWPLPATSVAAALPPALVTQRLPAQLGPAAELAAEQQLLQQLPNHASFAWGGPGLEPLLGAQGGLQGVPQWASLPLPPGGLAAAAAGAVSHHSTPRASAASQGGTDDTPSIGPTHGPAACQQGQQEHSEGAASGSAACSEGAARSVGHVPFPEQRSSTDMLAGACGLPAAMHMQHQLEGFPGSGLLLPQQQYGMQAEGRLAGGDPLPAWLHGLQLGGSGAAVLLPSVDVSALRHSGGRVGVSASKASSLRSWSRCCSGSGPGG